MHLSEVLWIEVLEEHHRENLMIRKCNRCSFLQGSSISQIIIAYIVKNSHIVNIWRDVHHKLLWNFTFIRIISPYLS